MENFNLFPNEDSNDMGNNHYLMSTGRRSRERRAADDESTSAIKDAETFVPKNYSIHEPPMTGDGKNGKVISTGHTYF